MNIAENPRAIVGGNNPPGPIDIGKLLAVELAAFLDGHPAIQKHEDASQAAALIERARKAAAEIEEERETKVRPLNERVKAINAKYKAVHNEDTKKPGSLDKIVTLIKSRQGAFLQAEEARKAKEAEAARQEALAAQLALDEAAEREREALDNSAAGEFNTGLGEAIADKADAEAAAARAARQATIAERDVPARIATAFGRTQVLRTHEVPAVASPVSALMAMWSDDKARDTITPALISAARQWKAARGAWPNGITITIERKL